MDAGNNGETFTKDTTEMYTDNRVKIAKNTIDSLFKQLNTTKDNFTLSFIEPKLKPSTKRQILNAAKNLDKKYMINDADSVKQLIEKIQHFDKMGTYIKLKNPDPQLLYSATNDVWNSVSIYYINNNDTTKYIGDFERVLGQPFQALKKENGIVNLEINTLISNMLPMSSALKKQIAIDSITIEYLEWYIDNL